MKISIRNFTISLLALCGLLCSFTATAAFDGYLVTADMLTSRKVSGLKDLVETTLDPEDRAHSAVSIDDGSSFTVELSAPITLSEENGGLVVMFGRADGPGAPTATMVEGSNDGVNYEIIGYAYMQARGPKTIEYSDPLYANGESKEYSFLHFTVLKTDKGTPCFSKFNLFILKKGEEYPDGRIDPLRLNTDYYNTYQKFDFKPTKGILDQRNHFRIKDTGPWSYYDGEVKVEATEDYPYPETTPWGTENTFTYAGRDYTLPTFEMSGDDTQMPHVTEHTVYAMPGDIVPLQPFYEMPVNPAYMVRFAHWYQYNPNDADGNPVVQDYSHVVGKNGERLLDFLIDPSRIAISDNYGYYAGGHSYLPLFDRPEEGEEKITNLFVIKNEDDFELFSKYVNGEVEGYKAVPDLDAVLLNDLDFDERVPVTIGSSANPYRGKFNGNGHVIKNMTISSEDYKALGLFSYVNDGAQISNLVIDGFSISNNGNTGVLIGEFSGKGWNTSTLISIDNVYLNGNVSISGNGKGALLIGRVGDAASIEVKNVGIRGTISGDGAVLVGESSRYSSCQFLFENCYADVQVNSNNEELIVRMSQDKLRLNGNKFNVTCYSAYEFGTFKIYDYAKQNGIDNTVISSQIERSSYDWNSGISRKINICKNDWDDFVLLLKNGNGTPIYIAGCVDKISEKGKDYAVFNVPDDYINGAEYGILPYKGSKDLKTDFEWGMAGLSTLLYAKGYTENGNHLYIDFESENNFAQILNNDPVFGTWISEAPTYHIPPMEILDADAVAKLDGYEYVPPRDDDPSGDDPKDDDKLEKYVSHPDKLIWDGFEHPWYGSVATFYQPLNTNLPLNAGENLELGEKEYHIAADFSHQFAPYAEYNLDEEGKTIYSPIINFRHIFHVYDGKTFADNNASSKSANDEYIRNKRRVISARAGKDFQVRLPSEFPVPTKDNIYSSTNFYYQSDDGYYRRAHGFRIEVTDKDDNSYPDLFEFSNDESTVKLTHYINNVPKDGWMDPDIFEDDEFLIALQGTRQYVKDGALYHTAGGEGFVHRMLVCNGDKTVADKETTYIVRIIALDEDGNDAKMSDGSAPCMMEYEISFLPASDASFVLESELKKYDVNNEYETNPLKYHKDEYLQFPDVCGEPVAFLNFDEYKAFEDTNDPKYKDQDQYFLYMGREYYEEEHDDGSKEIKERFWFNTFENDEKGLKSFKWPTEWSQCSYSFGYGDYMAYDYNEYQIANHSSQVHHSAYANDEHKNADGSMGVYDRLYYDTNGKEKGFFYYVNAASDPGVTSRLRLDKLCMGSTVVVTAWVSEFTFKAGESEEQANVAFNFSAVMKDESRTRLHSFITGYITEPGEWYHVYYSFVPVVPENVDFEQIHHYELELENNCKSSKGADYAIDDIRMYIVTPQITATQVRPLCDDNVTSTGVRISTRFDKLLDAQGMSEANGDDDSDCKLYVAIFDKAKFDKLYSDDQVEMKDALQQSLIQQENGQFEEDGETPALVDWLLVDGMHSNFAKLLKFDDKNPEAYYYKAMGELRDNAIEYLNVNIMPVDEGMHVGKQYYVCLRLIDGSISNQQELTIEDFSVSDDDCAKYGVMTLKGSGIVKVDGFAYTEGSTVDVCLGQAPVIQVELLKTDPNGKTTVSKEKFYYDWYFGSATDFSESVFELLSNFRDAYPDATEIPTANHKPVGFEDLTDEEYNAIVKEYEPLVFYIEQNDLVLHQSSLVLPPLYLDTGKIYEDDENNLKYVLVTAMPIIPDENIIAEENICPQPNEIRLNIIKATPNMYDGFEGIEYPGLVDVPLRVGLRQLRDVSTTVTKIPDDFTRRLQVPLRDITSYQGENADARMRMRDKIAGKDGKEKDVDPYVYIVETNDPVYKSLTAHPGSNLVDPGLRLHTDKTTGALEGLLPVGMVTGLTADTKEKGNAKNAVNIVFTKDMQFREGYYYKLRFDFNENLGEGENAADVCAGQVVFTIKVVPEYQRWTGAQGRNWNNDANWRRVSKNELFLGDTDAKIGGENGVAAADHTTDSSGNNDNALSYAPMDFTKVIIPNDVDRFPLMFSREQKDVQILNNATRKWDEKVADADASNHTATKDIKYDMASLSLDNVLACRPWYANTCEEIHFQYGAELQRQQFFICADNYQKAWVDLETEVNRWYTLATPLQGVVAGDMYTISAGAKQNTELFQDITFNNNEYGRFEPAVYQRSWNRAGKAEIYSFEDKKNESSDASYGISLNWSRVYNQVDVDYSGGVGFSINTRPNEDIDDNKVRFRLPKADERYSYFTPDDKSDTADDKAISGRENRHKLNIFPLETKLSAQEASKYFLVGNPFIAQMDMAKFFDGNTSLERKYWIMSGDRQMAYLWNGNGSNFISTAEGETGATVAPMQGFFVEAKEATQTLTINFTADMIKVPDGGGAGQLKAPRPEAADLGLLRISALTGGDIASSAVINLSDEASQSYDYAEDAAMLLDSSQAVAAMVYTVASGKALAINSLDRIEQTEVGVVAAPEALTTLIFEGVGEEGDLKLLDTATGQFSDLYEGMEYEVEGSVAGRLYIINSVDGPGMSDVAVVLDGRTVSVVSGTAGIVARAYDPLGLQLGEWTSGTPTLQFDLNPGIVLIEVVADGRKLTRKYIVK